MATNNINNLLIRGSNTSGVTPSSLAQGTDDSESTAGAATEIAINRADGKLFYLNDSDQVTEFSTAASVSGNTFATDLKIGRDAHNNIDFSTDDQVTFNVANAAQLVLTNNLLAPSADDDLDLGSSSKGFQDLYLEGNLNFTDDSNVTNVSTIQGHSGSHITLDSQNDIILDANGGDVSLKDDGTQFGALKNSSTNLLIESGTTTAATFSGANLTLAGTLTVTGNLVPAADDTHDLGTTSAAWQDLHIEGNIESTDAMSINSGAGDISFGPAENLTLGSNKRFEFRDDAIYIHSSTDGQLDLVADTEIQIAATTIDMNGALDLSGNATVGGDLTVSGDIALDGQDDKIILGDSNSYIFQNSENFYIRAHNDMVLNIDTPNDATTRHFIFRSNTSNEIMRMGEDKLVEMQGNLNLDSDAAVQSFGDDQDVTLTHVADTGLLLNSSRQLQFGDSGTYIHQSADGVLDLVSDTEIEINATTIDINGAVVASGEIAAGSLDISGNVDIDGTLETDALTINGTTSVAFTSSDHSKLDGIEASATADQTKSDINGLAITTVGTIDSGVWNGTAIASAYLDSDTAHLSGTQTHTGAKTFSGGVTLSGTTTHSGILDITNTTDSSDDSGDTGALRVEGGASIAKKLYVGTDLDVDGTAELDNITIGGQQGSDGQVLTSTGSGVAWEDASGGGGGGFDTAGTGLTSSGTTVNVIGGTGVTANANDIAIGQAVGTTDTVQFGRIGVDNSSGHIDINNGYVEINGDEGAEARILLFADQGDDNADKWKIHNTTSNTFEISNKGTGSYINALSLTSSAQLTLGAPSDQNGRYQVVSGQNVLNGVTGTFDIPTAFMYDSMSGQINVVGSQTITVTGGIITNIG